jgi:hypothetical protein
MSKTSCFLLANGFSMLQIKFEFFVIWLPVVGFSFVAVVVAVVACRRAWTGRTDVILSSLAALSTALPFVKTYAVKTQSGYPSLADGFLVWSCLACIPACVAVALSIARRCRASLA